MVAVTSPRLVDVQCRVCNTGDNGSMDVLPTSQTNCVLQLKVLLSVGPTETQPREGFKCWFRIEDTAASRIDQFCQYTMCFDGFPDLRSYHRTRLACLIARGQLQKIGQDLL